jgi:hypothetical protein
VRRRGLNVQNFHSSGDSARYCDPRGCFQTTFSSLERGATLRLEYQWRPHSLETQVLLDDEEEVAKIAKDLKVPPPPRRDRPALSTDLVATVDSLDGTLLTLAIACKPLRQQKERRVKQLLDIQRVYWEHRGAVFETWSESDVPQSMIRNLRAAVAGADWMAEFCPADRSAELELAVSEAIRTSPERTLIGAITDAERDLPERLRVGMTALWSMIWHHRFATDLDVALQPWSLCSRISPWIS